MIKTNAVRIFFCVFGDLAFAVAIHLRSVLVFADGFVIIAIYVVIYQKNQILCAGKKHQRRKQYGEQQFHCDKIKAIINPETLNCHLS